MRCYLRAENEGLTIGSVQINVLEVRHDSVLLGIHDPSASPTYREEVLYIQSYDDDQEDAESAFEPLEFQTINSFAIPLR
jgi:sRNA-binding carbon storage regulator CsrA